MTDDLFIQIKDFLISSRWEYDFEMDYNTSLQEDLKIYGDEASEVLVKFCNRFNVKYDNFKFDEYFRSEPSWTDFFKKKKTYKKFTLEDLINAVKRGDLNQ